MKLGIISDLHLDHNDSYDFKKILSNPELDCLIIAGDISQDKDTLLELMSDLEEINKLTLVVLGNHDYYNSLRVSDTIEQYQKEFQRFKNVKFLNNSGYILDDYKICGTTGWYPGSFNHNTAYPDFRAISLFEFNRQLHYNKAYNFLYSNQSENTIFVTHHVPYDFLIDSELLLDERSRFYLMKLPKILKCKMWIFGHSHMTMDREINRIRYVNNPFGYYYENIENELKIIEI